MSQLSHKRARALLQKKADLLITCNEKAALDEHLLACKSCNSYAKDLLELEEKLRKATYIRWNRYTFNLEFQSITKPTGGQKNSRVNYPAYKDIFAKITVVTTLVVAAFFSTQILGIFTTSLYENLSATPTRTPLAEYKDTVINEIVSKEPCDPVRYIVKESDTLENIAFQFGVSKERIIEFNHLVIEKIQPGTNLLIPMCTGTATRTAMIPSSTHTNTPTGLIK